MSFSAEIGIHCEWWIPETKEECWSIPTYILDCDQCQNAFVCREHVGAMVNQHYVPGWEHTLHIDLMKVGGESVVEEVSHGSE